MKPVLAISLVVLAIPVVLAQTIEEQTKLLEEQNKQLCISACGSGDVDCHAVCDHAPHPKPVHMNLMTECVAHCTYVQADGSAAALAQYNICRKSCIDGYMALKGDLAAPTTKTWTDVAPSTWSAVSVSVETTSGVSDVTASITGTQTTGIILPSASASGKIFGTNVSDKSSNYNDNKSSQSGASKTRVLGGLLSAMMAAMAML